MYTNVKKNADFSRTTQNMRKLDNTKHVQIFKCSKMKSPTYPFLVSVAGMSGCLEIIFFNHCLPVKSVAWKKGLPYQNVHVLHCLVKISSF